MRYLRLLTPVLSFVLIPALTASLPALAQAPLTIATQAEGSTYHQIGVSLAEYLNAAGVAAQVKPYKSWADYLRLIDKGKVGVGFVIGIDAGASFRAKDEAARLTNLRALGRLWTIRYTYLARSALGIKNLAGLRGRRVGLDVTGNPTLSEVNAALLRTVALGARDMKASEIAGFPDGIQRLTARELEAVPIAVGVPLVRQARLGIQGGVNYVSLFGPNATTDFLANLPPGLYVVELQPDERIPEIKEPTKITAFDVFLIGHARLSNAHVEAVLKQLNEKKDALEEKHPVLRPIEGTIADQDRTAEIAAPTNPIPYHSASIAYFKTITVWNDANERAEERLKRPR
ncbi:MAG: hypothetical protein FJX61_14450 [Alphaproteobacteria bacterium]|nr:hypothetical protein [Alphaproteobacteria bacterium]